MKLDGDQVANWQPVRADELQQACRLEPGAVHVWRFSLDEPPYPDSQLAAYLSADERSRAARFVFERDRQRFESGRGVLRVLLGAYVGREPATLRFDYGPAGKPALMQAAQIRRLAFNVSHSEAWALVGVTELDAIGVDLEAVRPMADAEGIARQNFARGEVDAWFALPESERHDAFFRVWAGKEAYVKALGSGLSMPLDRFEVSLAKGEPTSLLSIDGSADAALAWTLCGFRPHPAAWAAVAVPSRGVEIIACDLI
jgi:4'-phosphopantetheinyl transferase